jgi:predicted Zn-dependent protease
MDTVERFEAMLAAGRESPLLRLTLGTEYLKRDDPGSAIGHLARAVELDPGYSAAWQHLGRAFEQAQRPEEAESAWRSGIEAADGRGDAQAAKVMRVWLRRLDRRKAAAESGPPGTP